jgi:hypothetical protein
MNKINYPFETNGDKETFLNNYFDELSPKIKNQPDICKEIKKIDSNWDLKKLLTADFEELIYFVKEADKKNTDKLKKLFYEKDVINLYKKNQRTIADFLIKKKVSMKSCFYCNIDHINPFNVFVKYETVEDFIKYANINEWIGLISKSRADIIYKYLKKNKLTNVNDLSKIKDIGIGTVKKITINNINKLTDFKDHFTLDHVLPKEKYPFLSLSLFNLVPCCSPCNSKFKHSKNFSINDDFNKVVPSSEKYELDKLLKFKILRDTSNLKNFVSSIKKVEDLDIKLINNKPDIESVNEYMHIFQLKGRYEFHKGKAFDMIEKRQKYSDSQIKEIANITKQTFESVKKDIFGKECFEDNNNNEPFEKYKQDIAKQLEIIK